MQFILISTTTSIDAEHDFYWTTYSIDLNCTISLFFLIIEFSFFLGLHPWHREVPSLGAESELQLLAYTTATATWDPRHIYDLHCSPWQCQILNPLSGARHQTCILMDTSQVLNLLSHNGNSWAATLFLASTKLELLFQ